MRWIPIIALLIALGAPGGLPAAALNALPPVPLADHDARQAQGLCPTARDIEAELGAGTADIGLAFGIVGSPEPKMFQNSARGSASWDEHPALFAIGDVLATVEQRALFRWQGAPGAPRRCAWIDLSDLIRHEDMLDELAKSRGRGPAASLRRAAGERIGAHPLLVRDLRARTASGGWIQPRNYDPQNDLVAKAILNNLNTDTEGVPARATPDSDEIKQQLVLGRPFVVFDVRVGKTRGGGNVYYLLGESANRDFATTNVTIHGWVHEEDLFIWSTRMAASWRGNPPFLGWRHLDDALQRNGSGSAEPVRFERDGNHPVIFPATPDAKNIVEAGVDPFPILQVSPSVEEVQRRVNTLRLDAASSGGTGGLSRLAISRAVDAYLVAVSFGFCDRDDPRACDTPSEYAAKAATVATAREKLRTIDILFLIDNTQSMARYFSSAAQALTEFLHDDVLTTGGPNSIYVGVATYADYIAGITEGTPDRVTFNVVRPISDVRSGPGATSLVNALRNQSVQPPGADPWNDEWEAPFAALVRAATDPHVQWRPNSGIRLVIHVADAGNRAYNEASPSQVGHMVEKVSREMVLDSLSKAHISYVPIQVASESRPGREKFEQQARKDFEEQATAISSQRGLLVDKEFVLQTALGRTEEEPDRVKAVRGALKRALATFEGFRDRDSALSYCGNLARERREITPVCVEALQPTPATPAAQTLARLTRENGYDEQQVANQERRRANQIYVWVRPVETVGGTEVDRLDYWAALEGPQAVQRSQEAMRLLCDVFRRQYEAEMIDELDRSMKALADLFVRSHVVDDQALAALLQIPFWERQEILSLPVNALLQGIQSKDREKLNRWRRGFCVSAHLLEDVRYNRLPTNLAQIRETPTEVSSPPNATRGPFEWSRVESSLRDAPVYYVPYFYFPTDRFPPE